MHSSHRTSSMCLAISVLALILAAGCTAPSARDRGQRTEPYFTAQAGSAASAPVRPAVFLGLEVRSTAPLDAATALDIGDLGLTTPGTTRWRVVAGDGVGTELWRTIEAIADPASSFGATIAVRTGGPSGPEQSLLLAPSSDGGLSMPATLAHADRAMSLFEPALGIVPRRLVGGDAFTSRASMRVVGEADRSRVRQEGEATRSMRIVDRCRIATPLGELEAVRVEIEFRARLALANASERAVQYIVPGLGLVAEERRKEVRALGILGRTVTQTAVRIDGAPAD